MNNQAKTFGSILCGKGIPIWKTLKRKKRIVNAIQSELLSQLNTIVINVFGFVFVSRAVQTVDAAKKGEY